QGQQVGSTGDRPGRSIHQPDRIVDRFRSRVLERLHAGCSWSVVELAFVSSDRLLASASSTRSRVTGASWNRTPIALVIALAIAGAVGTSGGSPMPFAPVGLDRKRVVWGES